MTDVVFWLPAINPYWHERFKALDRDGRVSFECWFNGHLDPARSWVVDESDMTYPHHFLPPSKVQRLRALVRLYRRADPNRLFTFHFDPNLWPAWFHRLRGRHVALYCLMTWDSWVKRTRMKELAKRLFFSAASSTLTPGPDSDSWARRYGARRLYRLHHAVDATGLALAGTTRTESGRLRLLYIGRLVPEKGTDLLRKIVDGLESLAVPVELQIVGDGRQFEELSQWAASPRASTVVRVAPFVQADKVPMVYADADLLLFTTLGDPYGLVVDEALATGMPVISSDRAGDISWRLADGRGWVLSPEDPRPWVDLIRGLVVKPEKIRTAGAAASAYSRGHDVNRWVGELVSWVESTSRKNATR